jgi:hypothetical protein
MQASTAVLPATLEGNSYLLAFSEGTITPSLPGNYIVITDALGTIICTALFAGREFLYFEPADHDIQRRIPKLECPTILAYAKLPSIAGVLASMYPGHGKVLPFRKDAGTCQ